MSAEPDGAAGSWRPGAPAVGSACPRGGSPGHDRVPGRLPRPRRATERTVGRRVFDRHSLPPGHPVCVLLEGHRYNAEIRNCGEDEWTTSKTASSDPTCYRRSSVAAGWAE